MFRPSVCLFLFCMIVTSTLSCEKDNAPTQREKKGAALRDSKAPDQQGATPAQQKAAGEEGDEDEESVACDFDSVPALTDGAWPTDVSSEVAGGEIIEGTCKASFTGTPSIVCKSSGAWSKIRGACVSGDVDTSCPLSSLPALGNGTWPTTPTESAPGETVSGTCSSGFAGTPTIACKADGSWDSPDGTCTGADTTGSTQCTSASLPSLENGSWPSAEATAIPGTTINGTCASGFTGSPSVDCLPNGTWEPLMGACSEEIPVVRCTNVSSVTTPANFGAWTTTEAEAGDDITGTCASGFTGGFSVSCSDSGSWGTPVGGCTPADAQQCSSLSTLVPLSNGNWQRQTADWGATVTGTCQSGYTGVPSISCQSGNWSSFSGACSPRGCESLSTNRPLSDGTWNAETAAHGTTVQADCTAADTTASVSCSFGSWGFVVNGCTPPNSTPCTGLSTANPLLNGSWPQETAGWGGSVTATCNSSYVGYPSSPTVTCNSGTWSGISGGSCTPGCSNPESSQVASWDFTSRPTTAEYNVAEATACGAGFFPSGTGTGYPTATCSTAGWSYDSDKACIACNPDNLLRFDYGSWNNIDPYRYAATCEGQGVPPYVSARCASSTTGTQLWEVIAASDSSASCLALSYSADGAYQLRQRSTDRYLDSLGSGAGSFYHLRTVATSQSDGTQSFTLTKLSGTTNKYRIKVDQFTDRYLDAYTDSRKNLVVSSTLQDDNTQKWQFVGIGESDAFKIKQVDTGKCITAWNNSAVVADKRAYLTTDSSGDWLTWQLVESGNIGRWKQVSSGRYLDAYTEDNGSAVTRTQQNDAGCAGAATQDWEWDSLSKDDTVIWQSCGARYLHKNDSNNYVIMHAGAGADHWNLDVVDPNTKKYKIKLEDDTSKFLTAYDFSEYAAHLATCESGDAFIWELVPIIP